MRKEVKLLSLSAAFSFWRNRITAKGHGLCEPLNLIMPEEFSSDAGTGGGGEAPPAAPVISDAAPAVASTDASPAPGADVTAEPAAPAAPEKDAFLDELDTLGGPAETTTKPDATAAAGTEADKAGADEKADEGKGDAAAEAAKAAEAETVDDDDDDAGEAPVVPDPLTDWKKIDDETEQYIQKHIPKADWKVTRKAFRDANMAKSFMNPACPAHVFVENLANKSSMRFGEIESAILKKNAEADPVALLTKVFEATKDETGNSPAYQRLLDSTITTNPEYVQQQMKRAGYDLVKTGDGANQTDISNLSDAEIDAFKESTAYKQLLEVLPEDAKKLDTLLDSAKAAKVKAGELEAELAKKSEETTESPEDKQAREATEAQERASVENFSKLYENEVTSFVSTSLDKTYGLEISADEKEKSPMMAKLKSAKRAIIMAGGIDGSGDFDNDLYEWGKSRPAFKQAAEAMVKFTKAGETENARAAAKEVKAFAEMFLTERMAHEDVSFIDELIQMYATQQKAALEQKTDDDTPNSPLTRSATPAAGGKDPLLNEIDNM